MSKQMKWVDLFGIDPEYNKEALEAERAKLFEVFKVGYEAGAERYMHRLTEDDFTHDEGDIQQAFDAWLDKQVDDVDVLGLSDDKPERMTPAQRRALSPGPCDGAGHLPRSMGETLPDGTVTGMCVSCMEFQPMDEVIPPSKPEWRREFRLRPHSKPHVTRDA